MHLSIFDVPSAFSGRGFDGCAVILTAAFYLILVRMRPQMTKGFTITFAVGESQGNHVVSFLPVCPVGQAVGYAV